MKVETVYLRIFCQTVEFFTTSSYTGPPKLYALIFILLRRVKTN
jgi:hypothetical protein